MPEQKCGTWKWKELRIQKPWCSEAQVVHMTCLKVAGNKRLSWESKSHDPSPHLPGWTPSSGLSYFCVLPKAAGWDGNEHQMRDAFCDPSYGLPRKLSLDFYTLVTLESDPLRLSSVPSARQARAWPERRVRCAWSRTHSCSVLGRISAPARAFSSPPGTEAMTTRSFISQHWRDGFVGHGGGQVTSRWCGPGWLAPTPCSFYTSNPS